MANNTKSRQDENVYLWMTEESKDMLKKDRIAAAGRDEKGRVKLAVG